ncbi:MAG: hypothetical protein IJ059_00110 [Prevotella sp.]|nr:hypothetical protein [Prevotella sp.]
MKKLLIFSAIVLTWTACGGKKTQSGDADAAVADSTAKAEIVGVIDSIYVAAEETSEDDDFIEQTLPNTAVQKDENAEVILYANLDIAPTEDSNSQTSVWLKYKKSGKVRFLFNTNNDAKPRWEEMKDGNGITVPIEDIAAGECDNCRLIPWNRDKILVEGCPDSRNIWSYIYDIRNQNAIQLPSTEGLLDIDVAGHLFNMSLYRYHPEGGRYSVKRSYTIDGKYTGKEQVLEDD